MCSIMKQKISWLLISLLFHCSHSNKIEYLPARLDYFFHDLHIKNYESVMDMIKPWLIQARHLNKEIPRETQLEGGEPEVKQAVQKALIIALSKPGHDNTVTRLVQNIRDQTQAYADFFGILFNITRRACSGIKNEDRSPLERATYFYILENIIVEIRPDVKENDSAKNILSYIQQAKITIPTSVHSARYMQVLESQTLSPSQIANQILKKVKF